MYFNGRGVAQSDKLAVQWYKKAAVQGFVEAQYNLGTKFERGRGVTQSFKEAARWFRMTAEQGNPLAQFSLAVLHKDGHGVTQSKMEAVRWYKKAADQGLLSANQLGEHVSSRRRCQAEQERGSTVVHTGC